MRKPPASGNRRHPETIDIRDRTGQEELSVAVHDIAHVELFTRDKVSMVDHFVSAMGFTVAAEAVEVDRSSTLLRQGDVRLVVTTGHGIWGFLHQHGDGIADIALACVDVTATYEAARSAGAGPAPSRYGVPR